MEEKIENLDSIDQFKKFRDLAQESLKDDKYFQTLSKTQKSKMINLKSKKLRINHLVQTGVLKPRKKDSRKRIRFDKQNMKSLADSDCKLRIVVDSQYNSINSGRELPNFCRQIRICYSTNRRLPNPTQLTITSYDEELITRFICADRFDIDKRKENVFDCFDREKIIYLSPDSENILDEVTEDNIYVIGGIVDHNVKKSVSITRANDASVRTARFPIKEYMPCLSNSTVLTIDQAFMIVLRRYQGKDWSDILNEILPKRKLSVK
ncbi:MAG: tRNA methyltransferase 10 [Marteilia pararefringens]